MLSGLPLSRRYEDTCFTSVPFLKYGSRSNALKAGAPRGSSVWANIVIAPQLMSHCGWGRQGWEIVDAGSGFCF
jgi:hypothetical protein